MPRFKHGQHCNEQALAIHRSCNHLRQCGMSTRLVAKAITRIGVILSIEERHLILSPPAGV